MNRLSSTIRGPPVRHLLSIRRTYLTTRPLLTSSSSPPEAANASAESGGSRSKDAAEATDVSGSDNTKPVTDTVPDALAGEGAKGVTGGGKPLSSTAHPPPQPKIINAEVPGNGAHLTKEQQAEVDQHNKEFEARPDRAEKAKGDKVNQKFWSGGGSREAPGTKAGGGESGSGTKEGAEGSGSG
ncbi:hypothetical protein NKR23_g4179 [Pleurostoma richardsiae]|uniref:Uncharacterized protein n=1 Tax=Pleurostoma richardsiae TaxID=41990 RepID=A0AA38VL27_9PEZI|nr:hypothetical protein NKR23_g4179 [Pleurostoma richardsiae]